MNRNLLTLEGDLVSMQHLPPNQKGRLQALGLGVASSVLGCGYEVIHTLPSDLKGGESCRGSNNYQNLTTGLGMEIHVLEQHGKATIYILENYKLRMKTHLSNRLRYILMLGSFSTRSFCLCILKPIPLVLRFLK